jgi:phosphatidylinositol alpha-1,6-mannosyltransferase
LTDKLGLQDHVQFLGEVGDEALRRCYQQCDLFVLANRQVGSDIEGFGMVFLEAQACGKAVLGGASGGTAEAVNAPHSGLLVPCDAPGPVAEAVIGLLREPERRGAMGRAGRLWVEEQFDWPVLARRGARLLAPGMDSGAGADRGMESGRGAS